MAEYVIDWEGFFWLGGGEFFAGWFIGWVVNVVLRT